MARTAYFECFSGVSGDMIIASLLDAGLKFARLKDEIAKLGLEGYKLSRRKVERGGITGTAFRVSADESSEGRNLQDVLKIIEKSGLDNDIKADACKIFGNLAEVEGKIHNKPRQKIHFHEVGGTDCIIDVAGALAGLKILGIKDVYCSSINVGSGLVKCSHGVLPLPAPAAIELLRGVPVHSTGILAETATPTGAAIMRNVSRGFGALPAMRVEEVGYGAGARELTIPNMMRVLIGESGFGDYFEDEVVLIETNIDDMNPEFYGHVFEILLRDGALDVYLAPIVMKKGRPGVKLSVLASAEKIDRMVDALFRETTALGVRFQPLRRRKLGRDIEEVDTKFGRIRVKVARKGGAACSISPECDDCMKAALKRDVALKEVYEEAKIIAEKAFRRREAE